MMDIDKISNPILITGGSGFIGANLVRKLAENRENDIHLLLRSKFKHWRINDILNRVKIHLADLGECREIIRIVEEIKPKTIFHLAAYGAYPFQKEVDKIEAVNLHGLMNLLETCIQVGFEIFINTGSSSEYGFKNKPMKETDILEPNSDYAVFKAAATRYCQYLAKTKKLPLITIRPFSVYGPFEEPSRLVPKLITSLLNNTCPPLVAPDTARDYIYIDDVVNAYLAAAKRPDLAGEVFNIGRGQQTPLKQIVDLSIKLTGAKVTPQYGTMAQRIWDQNVWQADITKARSRLHWSPQNNLKEGLIKAINWFKNNLNLYQ